MNNTTPPHLHPGLTELPIRLFHPFTRRAPQFGAPWPDTRPWGGINAVLISEILGPSDGPYSTAGYTLRRTAMANEEHFS